MDRSRDSRQRFWKSAFAAGVLLVVITFGSSLAPYVRAVFANVFAPRNADARYAGLSRDALIVELQSDERALLQAKYQSVLYGLLLEENTKLRAAAKAAALSGGITARVLSRPPQSAYDTLLVDQGTNAGIEAGDLVEYQGIALGRVVSLGAYTALVQLFSSAGTDTDALVGKPQAIAVLHGKGGGAFELSVSQGVSLSAGDPIQISDTSLLLAIVTAVSVKPTDASQTVYAHSPVSFADMDFVEIIPRKQ